jgi:hypothetical protein
MRYSNYIRLDRSVSRVIALRAATARLKNSTPQNDKAVERVETNKSTCTIHYSGTRCLRFIPGIQSKQSGWAETGRRTPLEMLRTANEHRQRTNQKSSTTAQSIFSMHLKSCLLAVINGQPA